MSATGRILLLVVGAIVLVTILRMVGARRLRSKYALLWICVGLVLLPAIAFPGLVDRAAEALGIESGPALALFAGFVILLFVSMHFSWELSRLEIRTRALAEELALLRNEMPDRASDSDDDPHRDTETDTDDDADANTGDDAT